MEDPNDNLFTQNIVFHGGNFIVYPGVDESGAHPLQALLRAVFQSKVEVLTELASITFETVISALAISNTIARRLNHSRNMEGSVTPSQDIELIGASQGRTIAEAVTFTPDDLATINRHFNLDNSNLEPLILEKSGIKAASSHPDDNPLVRKPFVMSDGDLIVALPTSICYAIRNFLWDEAAKLESGREHLSKQLGIIYIGELLQYFYASGYQRIDPPEAEIELPPHIMEFFFQIDTDKIVAVFVCIDADTFGDSSVTNADVTQLLKKRREEIAQNVPDHFRLLSLALPVASQLDLFVFEFDFDDENPILMASFYDLLLCAQELDRDSLALWKYCRLRDYLSDKLQVQAFSFAEEFVVYSSNSKSFYVSDKVRPNLISVTPGECGDFIRRALVIPDIHLAYKPSKKAFREVRRISRDKIPVFAPTKPSSSTEHLVELGPLEIWLSFDSKNEDNAELPYSAWDLIDCFSYWCLAVLDAAKGLEPDRDRVLEFEIVVHLKGDDLKTRYSRDSEYKIALTDLTGFTFVSFTGTKWQLHLSHPFLEEICQHNNRFDALLVKTLYRGLRLALFDPPPEFYECDEENQIVELLTSNPNRKKIFAIDSSINRCLDPRNSIAPRYVDSHDVSEYLDELAEYLEAEGYTPGEITDHEAQIEITRKISLYFGTKALEIVKSLEKAKTLELLTASHDALVYEQLMESNSRKYTNACYYEFGIYQERLYKDTQRATKAALSIRTIIEMCASQASSGSETPTWETLDRLIALGELIVNWGRTSDEIQYELVPHELAILPTMRIGLNHDIAKAGYGNFYEDKIAEETQILMNESSDTPQDEQILTLLRGEEGKEAFLTEFGVSVEEFILVSQTLFEVSLKKDLSVALLTQSQLERELVELEPTLTAELVDRTINAFSQIERDDYFRAPSEFDRSEIFPWRYNRFLSLTRRPLVRLSLNDETHILFGARTMLRSLQRVFAMVTGGNLKAHSAEMRRLLGLINKLRGERFNAECATWFRDNCKLDVQENITISPNGKILHDDDLGDIDVLLIDSTNKILYAIECKEVNFAREPHQVNSEWLDIDPASPDSWISKHSTRHNFLEDWVRQDGHVSFGEFKGYKVHSVVLTSEALPTPYMRDIPMPIFSMFQFRSEGLVLLTSISDSDQ